MLILSRHCGEKIRIGRGIEVVVVEVRGDRVKLGITAPPETSVHREEVFLRIAGQEAAAADRAGSAAVGPSGQYPATTSSPDRGCD